jgi:uncharacterized protein involved in outer membrane biogenesis
VDVRRRRVWVLAAVLLYTLAGFLLVPWIAERQLVSRLSTLLDRPVRIERIRVNPYALSVEARGFAITEKDGAPLVGFDRLFIDLEVKGLLRWAWTLGEITLENPSVELIRFANGDSNLGRLIPPADPGAAPEDDGAPLPRLKVEALSITGGALGIRDETLAEPFVTRLAPIDFHLDGISTLQGEAGSQHLLIHGEGGTRLAVKGEVRLDPLALHGAVEASGPYPALLYRYLGQGIDARLDGGELTLAFDYRLDGGEQGIGARIANLALGLADLRLVDSASGEPLAGLAALDLAGLSLAWPEKTLSGASLRLTAPSLAVALLPDGSLNLQRLVAPAAGGEPVAATEPPPAGEPTPLPLADWRLALGELAVSDMAVRFDDRGVDAPEPLDLSAIALRIGPLSNQPGARFPLSASARVAGQGRFAAEGELGLLPHPDAAIRVTLADLPLTLAQPYLDRYANVLIEGGALHLQAALAHGPDEPLAIRGALDITGLETRGKRQKRPLLGWQRARIDNIEYSAAANSLAVSSLAFDTPYLRLRINEDQTTNFQRLLVTAPETGPGAAAAAPVGTSAGSGEPAKPLALGLGKITVANGTADFTDRTLPITFQTTVTALEGETSALDLASREPLTLALEGQVADYGLARVKGSLLPRDPEESTRLELLFRNVEVPDLSPYTVKFAGHEIASGRMDLDLRYSVEQGRLKGDNNIVLRDLELGRKVPYEGALDLPLGLAIALLRNPDGRIDIDLPVEGDMNNPEFRLGGVILSAIGNLLTRAVTAPFRLLGALVGIDSAQFDSIDFEPGTARLAPPEREKLAKLAEAMAQRPQLALEIPGAYAEGPDGAALREARVDATLAAAFAASAEPGDSDSELRDKQRAATERLYSARYPDRSLDALRDQHQVPRDPAQPEGRQRLDETAYLATLRRDLVAGETLGEADLRQLGDARGTAIAEALATAGMDPARLRPRPAEGVKPGKGGWIPLALGVDRL